MARQEPDGGAWAEVWEIVRAIPAGRVMTYGGIAALLRRPLSARAVGWALHGCPDDVPWQRVVNARGGCSTDRLARGEPGRQRRLLEAEGVEFGAGGRLELERFAWRPDEALDDEVTAP